MPNVVFMIITPGNSLLSILKEATTSLMITSLFTYLLIQEVFIEYLLCTHGFKSSIKAVLPNNLFNNWIFIGFNVAVEGTFQGTYQCSIRSHVTYFSCSCCKIHKMKWSLLFLSRNHSMFFFWIEFLFISGHKEAQMHYPCKRTTLSLNLTYYNSPVIKLLIPMHIFLMLSCMFCLP